MKTQRRSRGEIYPLILGVGLWVVFATWSTPSDAQAPARLGVSPNRFEIELGEHPTTHSIRIFNYDATPLYISIEVNNFDLDESNKTRLLPPTEQSLDQWIVINPVRVTVPAEGSQVVRFSIRPRVRPEPGEHRAMIYLSQELPPKTGTATRFRMRYGVPVYATVGPIIRKGELHSVTVQDGSVVFDVTSSGTSNIRIGGQYVVWARESYPGAEDTTAVDNLGKPDCILPEGAISGLILPGKPVLAGTRRSLSFPIGELEPGEYVLDINGSLGDSPLDQGIPFEVE